MALLHPKDEDGNVWISPYIEIETNDIICVTPRRKLVATIAVLDLFFVDTPDALLVCKIDREQEVRTVVRSLETGELQRN